VSKKKYRTVTPTKRETIQRLYQPGGLTYRKLHKAFNIPLSGLYRLVHGTSPSSSADSGSTRSSSGLDMRGRKTVFTGSIKGLLIETATANS